MVQDLVSTIIPVFNRPGLLREAVLSVLQQTYKKIEVIIVDDGSTDDTSVVITELLRQFPGTIRSITKGNGGPGSAREAGRRLAVGEFIQYLDSDDLLMPGKFERQVSGLKSHPECAVAYGKTRYYRTGDPVVDIPLKRTGEKIDFMFPAFLESRWWSTCTPLYRKEVCDKAGPWVFLSREEDWEYDCRIASLGSRLYFCDEFVADVREAPGGRLCRVFNLKTWQDRAKAHSLILKHAQKFGIDENVLEMQHFARELFLLSRQCGSVGLVVESKELFELSKIASGPAKAKGFDFKFYELVSGIIGWDNSGGISSFFDKFRGNNNSWNIRHHV